MTPARAPFEFRVKIDAYVRQLSLISSPIPLFWEGSPSTSLSRTSHWFGTSPSLPVWFPVGRISLPGRWWPRSAFPPTAANEFCLASLIQLATVFLLMLFSSASLAMLLTPFCIQGRWLPWDTTNTWHTSSLCTSSGWEDSMPFFIKNQVGESSDLTNKVL